MLFLYNISIRLYYFLLLITAFFNPKAKLWVNGRKGLLKKIKNELDSNEKHIWFHFASLGEFEQGRTVLEKLKKEHPEKKIVVTFFSPSGYEVRKNYPLADHVFYLPLDTPQNAAKFIDLINPELAIFTKYDYWLNYFLELKKRNVRLYVISAIFHPEYSFFKWYGFFSRKMLKLVTLIFVQDERSKELLKTINIKNVVVNGDTRFDRVAENAANPKTIPVAQEFAKGSNVLVAGSTWPEDERLLAELAIAYPDWKFIIAPHEVNKERIDEAKGIFGDKASLFSELDTSQISPKGVLGTNPKSNILIIDNIGMLSSLYQYGDIAYIGGGFGVGIHNTLEAAAFGRPIIFGPNYQRFREAVDLIEQGVAFSIKNTEELNHTFKGLQDSESRKAAGMKASQYVKSRVGATDTILTKVLKAI